LTSQPLLTGPSLQPGPASPNGAPQIILRRSVALHGATIVFILIAVTAVQASLAGWLGGIQAVPASLAVLAALLLGAWRHWRAEPAVIKIGPDGLTVWNRAGQTLAQGRIAGCSQWSGWLLILTLAGAGGRSRSFLLVADTLCGEAFRELAVLGRRTSRV
jgi:Membrane-bound toxin component of toxin-antitoxin system